MPPKTRGELQGMQKIEKHSQLRSNSVFIIVLLLVTMYFTYHAISGERGYLAYIKLNQKLTTVESQLTVTQSEKLYLEHRVQHLRPESLDLDLLDEQARRVLGYASPDEYVMSVRKKKGDVSHY